MVSGTWIYVQAFVYLKDYIYVTGCTRVYVHARPMIDTMSVTKSAIGLMYAIHEPVPLATTLLDHPARRVSYGDALNMMSGLHTEFDYFKFRDIVKGDGDVTAYALGELMEHSTQAPQTFEYNDMMYQLLASRFPDLRARFAEFMGGEDGWSWETDGAGTCLGPHGLSMTPECALAYAEGACPFYGHLVLGHGARCGVCVETEAHVGRRDRALLARVVADAESGICDWIPRARGCRGA
jgi:hypothetical protein